MYGNRLCMVSCLCDCEAIPDGLLLIIPCYVRDAARRNKLGPENIALVKDVFPDPWVASLLK
jgi:hypothetical protein